MPKWPEQRQIIGTSVTRLDGHLKVSGKAKYSYDRNLPGLIHAKILRSPHAHAKIVSMDIDKVMTLPGVKAVHVIKEPGRELFYAGDEIAAVAAETEEQARDAVRELGTKLIKYQVLPHISSEAQALEQQGAAVKKPNEQK